MLRKWVNWVAAILVVVGTGDRVGAQEEPKVYVVNYANTVPTIDGMLTNEAEWSSAAEGGDGWSLLGTGLADNTNNRFAALWDEAGLYFQHQVNYAGWQNRGQSWDSLYESLNLYFDPNTDGEPNANSEIFGFSTDGYHVGVNLPLGETEITSDSVTAGMDGEFYVNALFGDPSSWRPNLTLRQTTSVVDSTGYVELFIPWTEFNKTPPADPNVDPPQLGPGLYHPDPPVDGEEWYFNMTRAQTNGFLPAWNSPPSAFFFSERPHGILKFAGEAADPCDLDRDGDCDADDIDTVTHAVLDGGLDNRFDLNADGAVTDADRVFYVEEMLKTWIGDANLDGQFGTQDFVTVFVVGGYEDGIPGNSGWASGDWDGDLDFTTRDFVAAFISGGFEKGPRPVGAVAAVPEPASLGLLFIGLLAVGARLRKN